MENILVVGSGGHAKVVIDAIEKIIENQHKYHIIGLIDDYRKPGEETFDHRILGGLEDLPQLIKKNSAYGIVIAIGNNFNRQKVTEKIKGLCPKAYFPPIVHPSVIIGRNTLIGEGTYIGAGVLINPSAIIGSFCLLTTGSIFGHDAWMGDFSCILAHSVIGAYARIGFGSAISMGVTVGRKITIGEHTVIGAGSVVVRDIPSYVVAYGVPAKVAREREAGQEYF